MIQRYVFLLLLSVSRKLLPIGAQGVKQSIPMNYVYVPANLKCYAVLVLPNVALVLHSVFLLWGGGEGGVALKPFCLFYFSCGEKKKRLVGCADAAAGCGKNKKNQVLERNKESLLRKHAKDSTEEPHWHEELASDAEAFVSRPQFGESAGFGRGGGGSRSRIAVPRGAGDSSSSSTPSRPLLITLILLHLPNRVIVALTTLAL